MTENEALNTLHILLAHEKAIDAGEIVSPNNLHSQEKEALQFILEEFKALKEKSVAVKPLFSTVNRENAYHCGSCKKFVGFYDTRIYEYCHNCGQKIDWQ